MRAFAEASGRAPNYTRRMLLLPVLLACVERDDVVVPRGPPADRVWTLDANGLTIATGIGPHGPLVVLGSTELYGSESTTLWCLPASAPSGDVVLRGHPCLYAESFQPRPVRFVDTLLATRSTRSTSATQWFDPTRQNRGRDALAETDGLLLDRPCGDLDGDGSDELCLLRGFEVAVWFGDDGAPDGEADVSTPPVAGYTADAVPLRDPVGRQALGVVHSLRADDPRWTLFGDGPDLPPTVDAAPLRSGDGAPLAPPRAVGELDGAPGDDLLLTDLQSAVRRADLYHLGPEGLLPTGISLEPFGRLGPSAMSTAVADFDGDGAPDLATSTYGAVAVFRGPLPPGLTTLDDADVVLEDPRFEHLSTFDADDLDGDGRAELIVGSNLGFEPKVVEVWDGATLFP